MATFKGKNSLKSTRKLFNERLKYELKAFPSNGGMGPPQIVDFNFAERNLYGKVDRQHNPVYVKEEFIVPVNQSNNNESTILLLDFVAAQFTAFQKHYERACRMGLIRQDDALLSIIEAKRAYENPIVSYRNYAGRIMTKYYNSFLRIHKDQVINFNDFVKLLPQFLQQLTSIYPLTFSGFQRSSKSSIFNSGLVIDIGNLPFGDDIATQEQILSNPSYNFYINLAKQYGFSVNKREPSILICDFQGPGTAPFKESYDLGDVESIFNTRYDKTLYRDISELNTLVLDYYNSFVSMFPVQFTPRMCGDKTITDTVDRYYINSIDNNMYNNIIYLYINIRNIEERNPFDIKQIQIIFDDAMDLRKISDTAMLDYVDNQFKAKYNEKNGTLSYHKRKLQKKLDK